MQLVSRWCFFLHNRWLTSVITAMCQLLLGCCHIAKIRRWQLQRYMNNQCMICCFLLAHHGIWLLSFAGRQSSFFEGDQKIAYCICITGSAFLSGKQGGLSFFSRHSTGISTLVVLQILKLTLPAGNSANKSSIWSKTKAVLTPRTSGKAASGSGSSNSSGKGAAGAAAEEEAACHSCSICLDNFQPGDGLMALPCAHQFHASCVGHWLKQEGQAGACPVCKHPVWTQP